MPTINQKSRKVDSQHTNLGYQLFTPIDYEVKSEQRWPLILFLHGLHRRGEDLSMLDGYGVIPIAEVSEHFPFLVVTPQCPEESRWTEQHDALLPLLDHIITNYRVDPESIYLTGFSMGGNGTWDLAAYYPERFAAIAPVSGWYQPELAAKLKDIPIWTFHGSDDDIIPIACMDEMVAALQEVNGDIRSTTFPALKHNIINETYSNPAFYEWLLQYKRK
ncbi:alpha/beta hydrolase-fold protein [Paenibacillus sp. L3-i20]|uniref:carboxylesterase family protein n=1 Tax=Paenibacillus sp. L3-i20 TaxID=2905833 RepID=UPI001EDE654C|nr:PHB depolymerase family esterase [Paenibacillus sp. L3-i20]GKU78075.1 hydrolase [Paenibacillus sp. L3-i20]